MNQTQTAPYSFAMTKALAAVEAMAQPTEPKRPIWERIAMTMFPAREVERAGK